MMTEELECEKWNWGSLYPSIGVDKPLPLTTLEVRWINAFGLHIKKFVQSYPEKFEGYTENRLFETYRRRVFVFWMVKNAENQHALEKREMAELKEYRKLIKRREELSKIACDDGWTSTFYE